MILKVLGSVSPYCKDDKNCPGYLVSTSTEKILLDCGNGIVRNLILPDEIKNLTIIISHLHRDHYADLFGIAYASYVFHNLNILSNRIKVYIPKPSTSEEIHDYNLLTNLGEEQYLEIIPYTSTQTINLNNTNITFSSNPHNITSYSIKISEHNQSIVYSGDTGYLGNTLETFAKGTNLLICESTFLKGQTRKKDYHLYAHEAAYIAKKANVDKLLLTHFWPEIDREEYLKESSPIFPNTEVAIENKVLKLPPNHQK